MPLTEFQVYAVGALVAPYAALVSAEVSISFPALQMTSTSLVAYSRDAESVCSGRKFARWSAENPRARSHSGSAMLRHVLDSVFCRRIDLVSMDMQ